MISGANPTAAGGADRFAQAWQAMRHDGSIQFNLQPLPTQPRPPAWLRAVLEWLGNLLKPVGRFLAWLFSFLPGAAYAQILLWTVIVIGAGALLWALYNRLSHGEWSLRLPRRTNPQDVRGEDDWAPDQSFARSWLEEADALAREGRFAEAIHHLLFRSVDDISKRRPALVRPALTSRELAASQGVPARARELFAGIAAVVEHSLFGGRPVGERDWLTAREAYSDFALPSAWRA